MLRLLITRNHITSPHLTFIISRLLLLYFYSIYSIDSDESVNKAAIAYAKDKRGNKGRSSMGGIGRKKSKDTQPSLADEDFVGVSLDAHGSVKRVFAV